MVSPISIGPKSFPQAPRPQAIHFGNAESVNPGDSIEKSQPTPEVQETAEAPEAAQAEKKDGTEQRSFLGKVTDGVKKSIFSSLLTASFAIAGTVLSSTVAGLALFLPAAFFAYKAVTNFIAGYKGAVEEAAPAASEETKTDAASSPESGKAQEPEAAPKATAEGEASADKKDSDDNNAPPANEEPAA
jgi:hypothetical protein